MIKGPISDPRALGHWLSRPAPLAVIVSLATMVAVLPFIPFLEYDSRFYIPMADGNSSGITEPYASRVLFPLIVRAVHLVTRLSLDNAFFVVGIASLLLLVYFVFSILSRSGVSPVVAVLLVFSPYLLQIFRNYYITELMYGTVVAAFFFLLSRDRKWWALGVLVLVLLTRQEGMVLAGFVVLVALLKRERAFALGAAVASVLGLVARSMMSAGASNVHQLNDALYTVLHLPYYLADNYLGVRLWTDSLAIRCNPAWTVPVPSWIHLGTIHAVGGCPFEPALPLTTAIDWLAIFGIAPTLLVVYLWKGRRQRRAALATPMWILIAVAYGFALLLLLNNETVISGGEWGARQFAKAWPAFWLGAPAILASGKLGPLSTRWKLAACHVAAMWIPAVLPQLVVWLDCLVLIGLLAVHYFAVRLAFPAEGEPQLRQKPLTAEPAPSRQ